MIELVGLLIYIAYRSFTLIINIVWTIGREFGFSLLGFSWNIVRPNVEFSSISILDTTIYFVAVALAISLNYVAKKIGLYDYVNPFVLSFAVVLLVVFLVSQVLFWLILLVVLVGGVFIFTQTHGIFR